MVIISPTHIKTVEALIYERLDKRGRLAIRILMDFDLRGLEPDTRKIRLKGLENERDVYIEDRKKFR